MKTRLAFTSLAAYSLLWLGSAQTAAGLAPIPTSANTFAGSLISVAQAETATAVGTITSSGNAKVTLKSVDINGGANLVFLVPVASGDSSSLWAAKVRTALRADSQVTELFQVGGTGSAIILTRKAEFEDEGLAYYPPTDATLNLALANDTAIGIITATISTNTTAGSLSSTAQQETATADGTITVAGNARVIVTAAGLPASPKTYPIVVSASDTASAWAIKVRTALGADSNLTSLYDVGGSSTSITLTRKKVAIYSGTDIFAANDPTLNINIDNFTCAGIIPQSISVNTTLGSLQNVGQVETATALGAVTSSGNVEVVVTSEALDDSPKKILVPVTVGNSASAWATKVRSALNLDPAVSSLFSAGGTGSIITLSRKADNVSPGLSIYPKDDPTLNLALFTGSRGITSSQTSANTTAGKLESKPQVETATAVGTISVSGTLEVVVTAAPIGAPQSINVSVLASDTAPVWAGKVRAALGADTDITNLFVVGGVDDKVMLTSKKDQTIAGVDIYPANDPSLNIGLVPDTDRDSLSDFDENNIHLTDPTNSDSDDDGFNDGMEIAESSDPKSSASLPASGSPHNIPNILNDPVSVNIDGTFQPFGSRPETDKSAEDGSVALRDQNGVIIWADNLGRAVRIPNSSVAKTLYVSNTECVIWQNRFDGTFNSRGSTTQIILYRRDDNGAAIASPAISMPGTVMETSPVSPSTYGWTFVVSNTFDSGSLESRQRFQSGSTNNGPTFDIRAVNYWHDRKLTLYRLTWDNNLQTITSTQYFVPDTNINLSGLDVLGNGSDGSLFISDAIGFETFDDTTGVPTDPFPGVFLTQDIGTWVITTQDRERIYQAVSSGALGETPTAVAHVTNSRLMIETNDLTSIGTFNIRDFRKRSDGTVVEDAEFTLPFDERLLTVGKFTRAGLPVTFYTTQSNKNIRLYPADASAPYTAGAPVTLPGEYLPGADYVRNPQDNSLLLQLESRELVWIPAGSSGLRTPVLLPDSSKAAPMFVSESQAVAWMNSEAPLETSSSGANVPIAKIYHFDRALNVTDLTTLSNAVKRPIEGRYVALPTSLTPDAKVEGWHISTFAKSTSTSAIMRTFVLRTLITSDLDGDGIVDADETSVSLGGFGTDPWNPDTDNDSVNDGDEIYKFEIVDSPLSWANAKVAAEMRGGWLATIADINEHHALVRKIGRRSFYGYWLGAADSEATQVETATAVGTIMASGNARVVITSSALRGSPKTILVPVLLGDTPSIWASKVRNALSLDTGIKNLFNISGFGANIVLARKIWAANDASLNIALSNNTSTGVTPAPTSTNTRPSAPRVAGTFRWVDYTPWNSIASTPPFTPPYRPTEPNGTASLNALSLNNDFKWSDEPATGARGYVIEYPSTNPLIPDGPGDADGDGMSDRDEIASGSNPQSADSDDDGLSDGTEHNILHSSTSDLMKDFLELDSPAPVFTGANGVAMHGGRVNNYEGLLYSEENGLVGKITITPSSNRALTGSFHGMDGVKSSITGSFDASGSLATLTSNPDLGWTDVSMVLQIQPNGRYHLHVAIIDESGDILYAKARPAIVTTAYASRSLTFEAKALSSEESFTGPAIATGTISTAALANFQIYLPDESMATFGGAILDGDVIALFAANASAPTIPVLTGNLKLDSSANLTNNLAGVTRLVSSDRDQVRQVFGSFYVAPRAGTRPLNTFANTPENAVLNWLDGELDAAYQVASWSATNSLTLPATPTRNYDSMTSTITAATGLMKIVYTRSEEARKLYQAKSTGYAVVNQGMNTASGFYVGSPGSKWVGGTFTISPNTQGKKVPAVIIPTTPTVVQGQVDSISPVDKTIINTAQTYSISVNGTDNWNVVIPTDVNWITAKVVNVDGSSYGNVMGRHNATLQITVTANTTEDWREANILIGNQNHVLRQRPLLSFVQGVATAIDRNYIEVRRAQSSHTIKVTGTDNWQVSIPSASSWISVRVVNSDGYVYPLAPTITGSGNAEVIVTVATNTTNRRRTGSISIGGITHTVVQAHR